MAQWWVVNQVSRPGGPRGPQQTNYVVKQSATRPVNAVAGPFSARADAEAWQTSANTAGNSPGSAIGGAADAAVKATGVGAFLGQLGEAHTWVRVGEFVLGLALFIVGLARVAAGTPAGRAAAKLATKAALI